MQSFLWRSAAFCTTCVYLLATFHVARAQDEPPAADSTPSASVARVSLIQGQIEIGRGDSSQPFSAVLNAPILGGDYITTGDHSRGEVQFDGNAAVRLGPNAQMRFSRLDVNQRDMQVAAGTIDVRLLRGNDGITTIDTPSISIEPRSSGSYRVTVNADGQTLVTVRSGRAEIDTPQGQRELRVGTTLVAEGAAANPALHDEDSIAPDGFDAFNSDRDVVYLDANSESRYVDPAIGGVQDLPSYGHWVVDESYGEVWQPTVAADWAPYRDGRWVWEEGYGWTWIGDEPWGWAPYHYGSWYRSPQYGWCWYPPQPGVAIAPWRPALVAFIGFGIGASGGGLALGFAGGNAFANIGWVPLAPFEAYHPWWANRYGGGVSVTNITNVTNVTNVTTVTNLTSYRNVQAGGVSSVPSERFLSGDFRRNVAVTPAALHTAQAQVFRGAIPVVPTVSNLRFSASAAAPSVALHSSALTAHFAGNHPVIARTPFTAQRKTLAAATHTALTPLNFKDARTTPLQAHSTAVGEPRHTTVEAPAHSAWDRFHMNRPATGAAPDRGSTLHSAPAVKPAIPHGPAIDARPEHTPRAAAPAPATHLTPAHHTPAPPAAHAPITSDHHPVAPERHPPPKPHSDHPTPSHGG